MQSIPDAELACRGHNYALPAGPRAQSRGVLSYYAIKALGQVQTIGEWLAEIEIRVQKDVDSGKLPMLYRPELQLIGDGENRIFR